MLGLRRVRRRRSPTRLVATYGGNPDADRRARAAPRHRRAVGDRARRGPADGRRQRDLYARPAGPAPDRDIQSLPQRRRDRSTCRSTRAAASATPSMLMTRASIRGVSRSAPPRATCSSRRSSAYMDVLRDRAIVQLDINNIKVLQTNLDATNDQFAAGSLTRTDVAQSRARLEDGQCAAHHRALQSGRQRGELPPRDRRARRRARSAAAAPRAARHARPGRGYRDRQQSRHRLRRRGGEGRALRHRDRAREPDADALGHRSATAIRAIPTRAAALPGAFEPAWRRDPGGADAVGAALPGWASRRRGPPGAGVRIGRDRERDRD